MAFDTLLPLFHDLCNLVASFLNFQAARRRAEWPVLVVYDRRRAR